MGVNKPLTNSVASRFAQRCVNLVVSANLTDTSDKLTDRYADKQTVLYKLYRTCLSHGHRFGKGSHSSVVAGNAFLRFIQIVLSKLRLVFVADVLSSFCFSAISRLANAWQQWGKPKPCWYVIWLYRLKANPDITGNTDSNMVSEPGGYSIEFYTERLRIEVQPLTLLFTIFDKKGTPCLYLSLWQMIPLSHT